MTTIYDIAKRTGLAPSTVSKALNNYKGVSDKTRRKVEQAVQELNYVPNLRARALMTNKSFMVGVSLKGDERLVMSHPHFNGIFEGFRSEMEKNGYDMLVLNNRIGSRDITYLEHCRQRGLDGVALAVGGADEEGARQIEELAASDLPKVSVEAAYPGVCTVVSDNVQGSLEALNYLYLLGHRRIGIVTAGTGSLASRQRHEAYLRFLRENRLEIHPDHVLALDSYHYEAGLEAARRLAMHGPGRLPTAMFCICDDLAAGLIDGLKPYNLSVPQDISVVGFDDSPIAVYYGLTTVRQPRHQIGVTAARVLLEQIEGRAQPQPPLVCLETELLIRESCRKLPPEEAPPG